MKPLYTVSALSWIGDSLVGEGKHVEYDGIPGSALEPANEAARKMVEKHGRRFAPEMPLMPMPAAPLAQPVDWQELAIANGWAPPVAAGAAAAGQAPQGKPTPAAEVVAGNAPPPAAKPVEGRAGGAAAKLNEKPAKAGGDAGGNADI